MKIVTMTLRLSSDQNFQWILGGGADLSLDGTNDDISLMCKKSPQASWPLLRKDWSVGLKYGCI